METTTLTRKQVICRSVKKNYHENGGKFKKMIRYYLGIHPEIDQQTFFTEQEQNDIITKAIKLKQYHDELKIFKYIKKEV